MPYRIRLMNLENEVNKMFNIKNTRWFAIIAAVFVIMVIPVFAEEAGGINASSDTAWVLVSAALVML
jgi:hypothetical protein